MRRALLIGSQTGALRAIDNDVARMTAALSAHGFACERRVGADARRAGILEGLERLIGDTRPGDAALVYYSGHGALALNPEYRPGREAPRFFQFIVPTDIDESGDDDFRGVLNLELSGLLARLTEKTQNVTVVLDCCHAARMCRGPALAKSLTRVWALGLDDHLRALRRRGGPALPHVESNPHAVRLVAAAVNQAAFEYTNPRGERISVLTESLALALRGALGAGETWASMAPRVRARVRGIMPTQRAEIEGPARRVLFELRERELAGALPCALDGDAPALAGGQLAGAEVGDVYELLDGDGSRVLATVIASGPTRARVRLDPPQAGATLTAGALARPVSRAPRRDAVYFDAPARAAAPARSRQR
ncbi:MAG: caspase family protein [Myxococcales bacterium]|nr:caspase family protein [Myxococcales bacterium]